MPAGAWPGLVGCCMSVGAAVYQHWQHDTVELLPGIAP